MLYTRSVSDAMAAFKSIVFALSVVLASANDALVPPSWCSLDNARYLPVYDLENVTYNVLSYDELSSFSKYGFYQFKDVQSKTSGGMFYGDYPVLVVYQPDEKVPELHGYHYPFPWGLRMVYGQEHLSEDAYAEYKQFREYLNTPIQKEGYTPSAALQIYPELENMKLTKIVQTPEEKITRGFALLFLLPENKDIKPKNFEQQYNLFEQFYYNGTEICKVAAEEMEEKTLDKDAQKENVDDQEDDDYVPLLTVYDRDPEKTDHNVVDLDLINEYFGQNGFYKFDNFVKEWLPYDEYPILIVIQPDEKVPELHGYYFDEGILSLVSYINEYPEFLDEYRPLFEYLEKEPDLDGLTPAATRFDYPHFLNYKLTRFIHAENVADQFAVVFLAPARHRPVSFLEKYDVLEDYGIGNKYIVEYQLH